LHNARELRRDLNAIEKPIETAGKETRRSLTRVVRDASHHFGTRQSALSEKVAQNVFASA
jgi:hypothetical protein